MRASDICIYREPERDPEAQIERSIAAQILITSMRDYHKAKQLIGRKNLKYRYQVRKSLDFLADTDREIVMNGKEAWEWFKNEPIEGCDGYTLQRCCDVLHLDVDYVRDLVFRPSTYRGLSRLTNVSYRTRKYGQRAA